jgi:ParB/RepB/Spo0J family partition protein
VSTNKSAKGNPFSQIMTRASATPVASEITTIGKLVDISQVSPNPQQIRQIFDQTALEELAADIKVRGILEPLIVREKAPEQYEIVAGERRYRAAQLAELKQLPVIVRQFDDRETRFAMLAENLQRQDLDPADEQRFFRELMEQYNLSQAEIAKLINKSRGYVQNRIEGNLQSMQATQDGKLTWQVSKLENSQSAADAAATDPDGKLTWQVSKLENSQSAADAAATDPDGKLTWQVSKLENSQSDVGVTAHPPVKKFNPGGFKRFSQTLDNALVWIKETPDLKAVEQIEQNIVEMREKLVELEQEVSRVKASKEKTDE